jgi:hypothetical protein
MAPKTGQVIPFSTMASLLFKMFSFELWAVIGRCSPNTLSYSPTTFHV